MPVYDYACTECGRTVEVTHGVHAHGPSVCEVCGGQMRKLLSAPAIVFKGSGWAKKDAQAASHARSTQNAGSTTASSGSATATPATSTAAGGSGEAAGAGGSGGSTATASGGSSAASSGGSSATPSGGSSRSGGSGTH